ncbi:DUF1000-domain-containing protein [Fomitiporia mediterranea MF3/22]|uniref:DUF1000-domain-containing protein n=1 Tax=Fomitiporia mediterranea (strain MF3/22) TaxID=694068 RepID=UPI00044090FF|nr:DUF1000-domain-containing protein [Fomitiporia mediterranea MF3/22]EJC99353.1 DUF1000-domain-containing protein [Fomitiporia mediterranea MF3/22]
MSYEHYGEDGNSVRDEIAGPETANLYHVVDRDNVHGLNLSVPEDAKALIKPWDEREDTDRYADSGVDDQLVIHVPFSQNVRVRSILLKLGRGELTPRHLRIYANHTNIVDFAEAESTKPQLNISLQEGETGVVEYPLRAAVFANVHSLSLHFNESIGEEVSRIYYIGFKGDTRQVQNAGTNKLEVPAENAADASLVDRVRERASGQQDTAR